LPDFSRLENIVSIFLQDNYFSGKIPEFFSATLRYLDVGGNKLTGHIPASIFQLPALLLFGASRNCINEELPASICQATKLKALYLDGLGRGGVR